jgi:hypothetical protein
MVPLSIFSFPLICDAHVNASRILIILLVKMMLRVSDENFCHLLIFFFIDRCHFSCTMVGELEKHKAKKTGVARAFFVHHARIDESD